ncbi:MerR family transcriptional regulator [Acetilactobacillus jinshanensis]|uniref:MerR family transcriptional regulator n=1 Tax=Acetilactobacillus jinshanensis TaxID=1720083 RepID=A0A4P6ZKF9_9LACO|nr:MerR family transcriptional regulator [Acetilactobacillus jinshanensis]QBP18216.1 MerR family transcriptional regulator [Acetilactobacillus jinshanensis]URL61086.1 MerR family transcriptional regulator [uncultured bacterium]
MNQLLTDIRNRFQAIFKKNHLAFNMNDISRITGLSRSQVHYWEAKGYIKPVNYQKNRNHVYDYLTLIKIELIQSYLKSGFTLKMASQKASQGRKYAELIHYIIVNRIRSIDNDNGLPATDFGALVNNPKQHVVFVKKANGDVIAKLVKKDH